MVHRGRQDMMSSTVPPPPQGLTEAVAAARLRAEGPNELPRGGRRGLGSIAFGVIREPMFGLLAASGIIYLLLGDLGEALMLLAFATFSMTIAVVQETRSEKVIEALRDLTSPRALVLRSGERRRIPGREVVRGDVVILAEGDRVPADGTLVSGHDLQIDELSSPGSRYRLARSQRLRHQGDRVGSAAPMFFPAPSSSGAAALPRLRQPAPPPRSAASAQASVRSRASRRGSASRSAPWCASLPSSA